MLPLHTVVINWLLKSQTSQCCAGECGTPGSEKGQGRAGPSACQRLGWRHGRRAGGWTQGRPGRLSTRTAGRGAGEQGGRPLEGGGDSVRGTGARGLFLPWNCTGGNDWKWEKRSFTRSRNWPKPGLWRPCARCGDVWSRATENEARFSRGPAGRLCQARARSPAWNRGPRRGGLPGSAPPSCGVFAS